MQAFNCYFIRVLFLIGLTALFSASALAQEKDNAGIDKAGKDKTEKASEEQKTKAPAKVKSSQLGDTRNVHIVGKNLLCGQPTLADLELAKKKGIKTVVSLRQSTEIDWDEAAAVKRLGLDYHSIPFRAVDSLSDKVFDDVRKVLRESDKKPVLLHCGSANRVAAVWLTYRVLDEKAPLEQATKEAKKIGLRTEGFLEKAIDYVRRNQKKSKKRSK